MGKELKTIGFAATVCLVCSLLLSGVYSSLRDRQELNKLNDLRSKVLQVFGVAVRDASGRRLMSDDEVSKVFAERVVGHVLDRDGNLTELKVEDLTPEQINERDKEHGNLKAYYPFYEYTGPDGTKRYAIHISGMGLWSVVKGYMALEADYETIAGIAFYDHMETPGLGGEIDTMAFRGQFQDPNNQKRLVKDGEIQHFEVRKPSESVDDASVHGPSGATMTSNGITEFINSDFAVYHKYFAKLQAQHG